MNRIPLTKPVLGDEELAEVKAVLESGYLVSGPRVAAFEAALSARLAGHTCVAVGNGTMAIHLALVGLGVGPGDEVIVPDFCFPSVASAVMYTGAVPVLCDVDPDTFNLDPERAARALSPRTKAVLAVHQFGIPCGARALAAALPCPVVEDAACALGAFDDDGPCGAVTDLGCFSFHPRKVLTTAEGGLVAARDPAIADRLRTLRNHGMRRVDGALEFAEVGYADRMSDVHAAIGLGQLRRLDAMLAGRKRAAMRYREALPARVLAPPAVWHPGRVYQGLVVRVEGDRDAVIAAMRERGIETTVGTHAIHQQAPFASRCRTAEGGLAGSILAARTSLTLPLWPGMPDADIDRVVTTLGELLT